MHTSPTSKPKEEIGDELFGLSPVDAFTADASTKLIAELQKAYVDEHSANKLTRAELARRLNVNRSQVTEILQGRRNVTIRTLFELVFWMGREAKIEFPSRHATVAGCNQYFLRQAATHVKEGPARGAVSGASRPVTGSIGARKFADHVGGNAAPVCIAAE